MYSQDEKKKAVMLYIENNKNVEKTIDTLGYPSVPTLLKWYQEYRPPKKNKKRSQKIYTQEEKQYAMDLYFKNGCNLRRTVAELGYGSATGLLRWLREVYPDKVSQIVPRHWKVDYPEETKQKAVLELINNENSSIEISEKYGISRATLYDWKIQYIGKGAITMENEKKPSIEQYKKEIESIRAEKKALEDELKKVQQQLYRAHLEKDVYEKAAEILKKEMADNLKDFTNREKAMVITALREKYPVKEILEVFDMAKSSYCYQKRQLEKADKYAEVRSKITELFEENKHRYGYRRIHSKLKRMGIVISEKIVRMIMKEEHLEVRRKKHRKYNSYLGEISPAVKNVIQRNFHADKPNQKWLTDITEFVVGDYEKVYLSPMIDCFDGMPVAWTIGRSPNASMVNTMLEQAISQLKNGEKPIIHSDRGCHYRWPGWIKRMEDSGLVRSMSKKGCSPDNSACEGFFGQLKNEMYYNLQWSHIHAEEFMTIVHEYMIWYREKRIKMSLGGMSPMEYRRVLGLV